MMGTSILAVAYDGGVIMGADSRTSTGSYVANRASDKLSPITDKIYCCRSGSAADTQAVSDMVRFYMDQHAAELGKVPSVKTAAQIFKDICYTNKDRLLAGIIVGGWDPENGGSIWSLPLGGTLNKQAFAVGGSGSTYIYGYLDAEFKENMTKEECRAFVTKGLSHAMSRDGSSGGIIRLAIIDKEGCERQFIDHKDLDYKQN
jgi:20S proteasome subunit beta 1